MSAIEREAHDLIEAAMQHGYSPATLVEELQAAWAWELAEKRERDRAAFAKMLAVVS